MKLPRLPDMDLDSDLSQFEDEDVEYVKKKREKVTSERKGSPKASPTARKSKKDKEIKKIMDDKAEEEANNKKKKPKIPKSQYDAEGNPILTIPDLNDVDLFSEIDRFFGEEDD